MTKSSNISVSVIIPTCDRGDELGVALNSLKAQIHRKFDVIVINDGHTDPAQIIAKSGLEENGIPVTCLSGHTHTGPSAARNRGLAVAKGEILAYLDDDDIFEPDHLQVHVEQYAADPDVHVVYTDASRCIVTRNSDHSLSKEREVVLSRDFDPDALLVSNYIPMISLSHRRECLDKSGMFEESLSSLVDWDLFIRLAAHYDFVHLPRTTSVYFEKGFGTSVQKQNRNRFVDNLNAVYKRTETLLAQDENRRNRIWDMRLKHLAQMLLDTGLFYEKSGNSQEALIFYTRATETHPDPEYYMAMARVQKKLGLKKEALISMQLASYCLNPEEHTA